MSMNFNRVTLAGHAGRDAEARHTPAGAMVVSISLATSRSWRDKNTGERVTETDWHRLVAYDRLAEFAAQYVRKGSALLVEGRLKNRKFTDKDGVERTVTEIVVSELQLADRRESGDEDAGNSAGEGESRASQGGNSAHPGGASTRAPANRPGAGGRTVPARTATQDDDVPF